jgi:hypothetical protein
MDAEAILIGALAQRHFLIASSSFPLLDYGRRRIFVEGNTKIQLTHKENRFHIVKIGACLPGRLRKVSLGGGHWTVPELVFESRKLIPALQQLLAS